MTEPGSPVAKVPSDVDRIVSPGLEPHLDRLEGVDIDEVAAGVVGEGAVDAGGREEKKRRGRHG